MAVEEVQKAGDSPTTLFTKRALSNKRTSRLSTQSKPPIGPPKFDVSRDASALISLERKRAKLIIERMSHFYRYIRALFFHHFIALSESQFQRMDVKVPKVEYDCERIAQSFHNSPLFCCAGEIATTVEVVELYGGRGVRVLRSGRCQRCGEHLNDELRMRD